MIPDTAFRAPKGAVQVVAPGERSAERWRQWELRNAATSLRDAKRMRFVFRAIFTGLAVWLAIQLFARAVSA